jgi:hypothetical protein
MSTLKLLVIRLVYIAALFSCGAVYKMTDNDWSPTRGGGYEGVVIWGCVCVLLGCMTLFPRRRY